MFKQSIIYAISLYFITFSLGTCMAEEVVQSITLTENNKKIEMQIVKINNSLHEVMLNGKTIYKNDSSLALILSQYLGQGDNKYFILTEAEMTQATYRLIVIPVKGNAYVSPNFGSGTVPILTYEPIQDRLIFNFLKSTKEFYHKTEQLWVFEKGKLKRVK